MSGQRHPDTEELESLRAGFAGGLRGRRLASHVARCARCTSVSEQLDAVSSLLASVPAPALPDALTSRITAALAAEAQTRATREGAASTAGVSQAAAEHTARAGSADRVPSHRRPRPARPRGRQLSLRFHPAMAAIPVIIFLVVGFGYLVTRSNPSSSSSSPALSEGAPAPAASAAASSLAKAPRLGSAPAPAAGTRAADGQLPPFLVLASGRDYTAAGLATQVRGELDRLGNGVSGTAAGAAPSAVPSASAASGGYSAYSPGGSAPSVSLIGCVRHLAGNATLNLVERASYQGRPVYVIVAAPRAWVVGLGCTAGNSELIAKVTLNTAP